MILQQWKSNFWLPPRCKKICKLLTLVLSAITLISFWYAYSHINTSKVQELNSQMLPQVTQLSCAFKDTLSNTIRSSSVPFETKPVDITSTLTSIEYEDITTTFFASQYVAGNGSELMLTQGVLYGKGLNKCGELAVGDTKARSTWCRIKFPSAVKQVAYNKNHALFLTVDGNLFACGENSEGQLVCLLTFSIFATGNWEHDKSMHLAANTKRKEVSQCCNFWQVFLCIMQQQ